MSAILVFANFDHRIALAIALFCIVVVAGCMTLIDFQQHRLPNVYTGSLALFSTFSLGMCGYLYDMASRTPRALIVGVGCTILFLILHIVAKLGMGDVKYAYTVGFITGWFGLPALITAFMIMSFTAAFVAVGIFAVTRDSDLKIAYGPYMSLGLVVSLLIAT